MKTTEFNAIVRELKKSKKFNVQLLKDCTKNQLMKLEDIMLDMDLSEKSLEKTLDIITDMLLNPMQVASKKQEEPMKEEAQKAKKTPVKKLNELVSMDYETLKIGDLITIYNDSIIDTLTRVIYKDANLVVTIDVEEPVTYEFKKEFIVEGGYVFKNKKYFLKLSK